MLKEIFEKNKNIIINADLDGILSGAILQKYYGCKVVGFSNSEDKIWVMPKIKDIYKPVYIDMYVNKPEVICIEQHIVSFDEEHHNMIKGYGTKINPNLDRGRFLTGKGEKHYKNKYPFGTVHYLLSLMAREGVQVELPILEKECDDKSWTIGSLILRADDALGSTYNEYYSQNARNWWNWLMHSSESTAICKLKDYVYSLGKEKAEGYKKKLGYFLLSLGCSINGQFKYITNDEGEIEEKFLEYINFICKLIDIRLNIPRKYSIYEANSDRISCYYSEDIDILQSENIFSYAFVRGHKSEENLSYTEEMTKISK